jgi:hypothetical protein
MITAWISAIRMQLPAGYPVGATGKHFRYHIDRNIQLQWTVVAMLTRIYDVVIVMQNNGTGHVNFI